MKGLVFPAMICLLALSACSKEADQITSFNECLLNNLAGISSDAAAAMVRSACREMFPEQRVSESNRFAKYLDSNIVNPYESVSPNSSESSDEPEFWSCVENIRVNASYSNPEDRIRQNIRECREKHGYTQEFTDAWEAWADGQ